MNSAAHNLIRAVLVVAALAPTVVRGQTGATQPDPSVRTIDALEREVEHLKELRRLDKESYDKAISLLQAQADKSPSVAVLHQLVKGNKDLAEKQFLEIDKRFEGSQKAIDDAYAAATKAIDKAEDFAQRTANSLDDEIGALTSRMDSGEGRTGGVGESLGYMFGAAGVLVALAVYLKK